MMTNDRMVMQIYNMMYKHYLDNKGDITTTFETSSIEIAEMVEKMVNDVHNFWTDKDKKEV